MGMSKNPHHPFAQRMAQGIADTFERGVGPRPDGRRSGWISDQTRLGIADRIRQQYGLPPGGVERQPVQPAIPQPQQAVLANGLGDLFNLRRGGLPSGYNSRWWP